MSSEGIRTGRNVAGAACRCRGDPGAFACNLRRSRRSFIWTQPPRLSMWTRDQTLRDDGMRYSFRGIRRSFRRCAQSASPPMVLQLTRKPRSGSRRLRTWPPRMRVSCHSANDRIGIVKQTTDSCLEADEGRVEWSAQAATGCTSAISRQLWKRACRVLRHSAAGTRWRRIRKWLQKLLKAERRRWACRIDTTLHPCSMHPCWWGRRASRQ